MLCEVLSQLSQAVLPLQGGHSPGKPGKVREFQSGQGKVRETSIILAFERAEELKLQLLWVWTLDMLIIDTLVAFSKLVTMLVIINVKQRLFKRYAVYR